jgi:sugar fermentation stimulation protein A
VAAHLPNTGRLTHLTTPGRRFVVRPANDPERVTSYTAIRAWDGCWVALEAGRAPELLVRWLQYHDLDGWGPVDAFEREVALGSHRIDLVAQVGRLRVWLEVKSGGRADGEVALLSQTPSTRAISQMATLTERVAAGEPAVVAFVVQRPDVAALLIGGDADPGWIDAVRCAAAGGVTIVAFGCEVTPTEVRIARRLPIHW